MNYREHPLSQIECLTASWMKYWNLESITAVHVAECPVIAAGATLSIEKLSQPPPLSVMSLPSWTHSSLAKVRILIPRMEKSTM